MKILIIGASGTIGKEIIKLTQDSGNQIITASRSGEPALNIDDPKSIENYFEKVSELDAIICVAGNASFGKLTELSDNQIQLGLTSKLLGQVNLVRKGLKKLNNKGLIILTGGMLAYAPWPETSNIAMVNAGIEGFVRAAALELEGNRRLVIIHPPLVAETATAMGMDSNPWPSARKVAETYLKTLTNHSNGVPVFVEGYLPQ